MNKREGIVGRRYVLTGMGAAAAGALGTAAANAQGRSPGFRPERHEGDAWMDELGGQHRVWIDTSYGLGGMEALHYANNILNANVNVDGGEDSDYAMVICWRHYTTVLGFSDEVWAKYGEIFSGAMQLNDYRTGEPFESNPANIDSMDLDHGGDTLDKMRARGVKFALCNAATGWYSRYVAGQIGGNAKEIYEEFVASALPDTRFVAAGVYATTRAQEYGYSLLYAG